MNLSRYTRHLLLSVLVLLVSCAENEKPKAVLPLYGTCLNILGDIENHFFKGGYDIELMVKTFDQEARTLPGLIGMVEVFGNIDPEEVQLVVSEFRVRCLVEASVRVSEADGWPEMKKILSRSSGENYLMYRDGKIVLYTNSFPDRKYGI